MVGDERFGSDIDHHAQEELDFRHEATDICNAGQPYVQPEQMKQWKLLIGQYLPWSPQTPNRFSCMQIVFGDSWPDDCIAPNLYHEADLLSDEL
jgi:hypothetical protein